MMVVAAPISACCAIPLVGEYILDRALPDGIVRAIELRVQAQDQGLGQFSLKATELETVRTSFVAPLQLGQGDCIADRRITELILKIIYKTARDLIK